MVNNTIKSVGVWAYCANFMGVILALFFKISHAVEVPPAHGHIWSIWKTKVWFLRALSLQKAIFAWGQAALEISRVSESFLGDQLKKEPFQFGKRTSVEPEIAFDNRIINFRRLLEKPGTCGRQCNISEKQLNRIIKHLSTYKTAQNCLSTELRTRTAIIE